MAKLLFTQLRLKMISDNEWPVNYPFHLIDRNFWYRGEPIEVLDLPLLNSSQVSNVVLFHTRGEFCFNFPTCLSVINNMHVSDFANLDIDRGSSWNESSRLQTQNWSEIPFNFLIGGDGKTYELRGWKYRSGFDEIPFNNETITVGLIGDFTFKEPAVIQVHEVDALISESIRRRKLLADYKIRGARLHEKDGHKMFKIFKTSAQWAGWVWEVSGPETTNVILPNKWFSKVDSFLNYQEFYSYIKRK